MNYHFDEAPFLYSTHNFKNPLFLVFFFISLQHVKVWSWPTQGSITYLSVEVYSFRQKDLMGDFTFFLIFGMCFKTFESNI